MGELDKQSQHYLSEVRENSANKNADKMASMQEYVFQSTDIRVEGKKLHVLP